MTAAHILLLNVSEMYGKTFSAVNYAHRTFPLTQSLPMFPFPRPPHDPLDFIPFQTSGRSNSASLLAGSWNWAFLQEDSICCFLEIYSFFVNRWQAAPLEYQKYRCVTTSSGPSTLTKWHLHTLFNLKPALHRQTISSLQERIFCVFPVFSFPLPSTVRHIFYLPWHLFHSCGA